MFFTVLMRLVSGSSPRDANSTDLLIRSDLRTQTEEATSDIRRLAGRLQWRRRYPALNPTVDNWKLVLADGGCNNLCETDVFFSWGLMQKCHVMTLQSQAKRLKKIPVNTHSVGASLLLLRACHKLLPIQTSVYRTCRRSVEGFPQVYQIRLVKHTMIRISWPSRESTDTSTSLYSSKNDLLKVC